MTRRRVLLLAVVFVGSLLVTESCILLTRWNTISTFTMRLDRVRWTDEDLTYLKGRKVIAVAFVYRHWEFPRTSEESMASQVRTVMYLPASEPRVAEPVLDPWVGWIETDPERIAEVTAAIFEAKPTKEGFYDPGGSKYLYFVCEDNTGVRVKYHFFKPGKDYFNSGREFPVTCTCVGNGWESKALANLLPLRAYWYVPRVWEKVVESAKKK